jgi:hypothetical protein
MRDRAYFSARAILQIHARARVQSDEHVLEYPVPAAPPASAEDFELYPDVDLYDILHVLECNFGTHRSALAFPENDCDDHSDGPLLWISNLFVELARVGPNPILKSPFRYLSAAGVNNQGIVANILVMWWILLGGHVEEETFWAIDKSCVMRSLRSSPVCLIPRTPGIPWMLFSLICPGE